MPTLIALILFAAFIARCWPYIKAGFDVVPDNTPYPVDCYKSPLHWFQNKLSCYRLRQRKAPTKEQRQWASVECAWRLGEVMAGRQQVKP